MFKKHLNLYSRTKFDIKNYNLFSNYIKFNFTNKNTENNFDYDLFVIGGGSGGLAASREAAKLGKKVGLADYIIPTPLGNKWGLGGTCVNVGCIPKKLYHNAALKIEDLELYNMIGGEVKYESLETKTEENKTKPIIKWEVLKTIIQRHIKRINFGYRARLRDEKVTYFNKYASLVDKNTILLTDNKNQTSKITADKILIAVGGRPSYGNYKGSEKICLTSDDIFNLDTKHPGKVLVVGASYIALECAGFLNGIGCDTTVMVRSRILGSFDNECGDKIAEYMESKGVKFINKVTPDEFIINKDYKEVDNSDGSLSEMEVIKKILTRNDNERRILVKYKDSEGNNKEEYFDNVLMAIGRTASTDKLNLKEIGVQIDTKSHKIITDDNEKTNIDNIYAIGDCALNRPELTPPAIKVIFTYK